jgi:hypothetical protein
MKPDANDLFVLSTNKMSSEPRFLRLRASTRLIIGAVAFAVFTVRLLMLVQLRFVLTIGLMIRTCSYMAL